MYKVFAFLKRNPNLTHDEYRAGHVGYHCGQSRRLKNIRGYLVNIWANESFQQQLGEQNQRLYRAITRNEPEGFLDLWDGFPEVFFDSQPAWVDARTVEPNRATKDGLVVDPDWSLADSPHLFAPVPDNPNQFQAFHLHMLETVVKPVVRREYKTVKLMQFFKRRNGLEADAFAKRLAEEYAPLAARLPNLNGLIVNHRDPDQDAAMRGFFAEDDWVFSNEGRTARREFCDLFDGANEYHFSHMENFVAARSADHWHNPLQALEAELFESLWYIAVDENLIVMPNRGSPPSFYFR